MPGERFRFGTFELDPADRRLIRAGAPVELNARYLDALILLVRADGALVTKDRFMAEVWRGVPVTDEALTQCIRTLRRALGDDAANPRFIATAPKHGYRFVASVERVGSRSHAADTAHWSRIVREGTAGTVGALAAGLVGGLGYGLAAGLQPAVGAASALLVLVAATLLVAGAGGAAVAFGIATARGVAGPASGWVVAGGALGGLAVGALGRLIGSDGFALLVGRSPGAVTGPGEGLVLGVTVGALCWVAARRHWPVGRAAWAAAALGGTAGAAIALAGGRMLGGSIDLLVHTMPGARLRLDPLGQGFGPGVQMALAALEGALFVGGVVAALRIAAERDGD